jgi:hypothetical protein
VGVKGLYITPTPVLQTDPPHKGEGKQEGTAFWDFTVSISA